MIVIHDHDKKISSVPLKPNPLHLLPNQDNLGMSGVISTKTFRRILVVIYTLVLVDWVIQ